MSSVNDPEHPLYVPDENRLIARERAAKNVELISDYLEAKAETVRAEYYQTHYNETQNYVIENGDGWNNGI